MPPRNTKSPSTFDESGISAEDLASFNAAEDTSGDRLQIDPRVNAEVESAGHVVQWKRYSIYGQEDAVYFNFLLQRKWTPVPAGICGGVMALPGTPADQPIIREGQILMQRPKAYQDIAEHREHEKAREQVRDKERQLYESPDGTFERTMVNVKKSYGSVRGAAVGGQPIED